MQRVARVCTVCLSAIAELLVGNNVERNFVQHCCQNGNSVEATFMTKFYDKLVPHCCRFSQQSQMLLRHCCWCERGFRPYLPPNVNCYAVIMVVIIWRRSIAAILTPAVISPERLKRESQNFFTHGEYIKSSLGMTDYPLMGVDVTLFANFAPNHIFGIGEVRHFKFRVLIHTKEYSCMHDIPRKGYVKSHATS